MHSSRRMAGAACISTRDGISCTKTLETCQAIESSRDKNFLHMDHMDNPYKHPSKWPLPCGKYLLVKVRAKCPMPATPFISNGLLIGHEPLFRDQVHDMCIMMRCNDFCLVPALVADNHGHQSSTGKGGAQVSWQTSIKAQKCYRPWNEKSLPPTVAYW